MSAELIFNDITWAYTLDRVRKHAATGLLTEIKYTFKGTYGAHSVKIANNYADLPPSDPTAEGFIAADDVTVENVTSWVVATISDIPIFDLELARVTTPLDGMDLDDPRQPANQDLSGFRFSSYKEQMQQTILAGIKAKIAEVANSTATVEHVFE